MSVVAGVADILELRQNQQRAVLVLLYHVRHAVRTVHLNLAGGFIHRKLVVFQIEFAVRQNQTLDDVKTALPVHPITAVTGELAGKISADSAAADLTTNAK